ATEQRIVNAGVVVGEEKAEALAHLERDRLSLEFLRVPGAHRKFALEGDDFRRTQGSAGDVPKSSFAGGGGDSDSGWAAVDVIGHVGRFNMPGQGANAAPLRLLEQRMAGQSVVRKQGLERSGATSKTQRVYR